MQPILYEYEMNPTTWAYLSSLLVIGIYFKFRRFWSVRNLDLLGLICLAPGLLLISHHKEPLGYLWLFAVGGCFLLRMLVDPAMVRRPLLEPNLSGGGMVFAGAALLVFLIGGIANRDNDLAARSTPLAPATAAGSNAQPTSAAPAAPNTINSAPADLVEPPSPLRALLTHLSQHSAAAGDLAARARHRHVLLDATIRWVAIVAQVALLIGMVLVGYRHFDSIRGGMAAATLYLLLPYTVQMAQQIDHVVPGALLVWMIAAYRRPVVAGALLGVAAAMIYSPLCLLPLWCSFYWRRGLIRFALGLVAALAAVALLVAFSPDGWQGYFHLARQIFSAHADGFWQEHESAYRIPIVAAYLVLCGSLALWPAQKNLGTLLSCTAAVMLAAQFWYSPQGSLYMAWYLPLLILTIFRPNLEDRVALAAVSERFFWHATRTPAVERPASTAPSVGPS